MLTVGILLFDEIEVLDFAGPFEVFSTASRVAKRTGPAPFQVVTVAKVPGLVRARGGLQVQPQHSFGEHPPLDVLLVPGGVVTAELSDEAVTGWIANAAANARLTAAVCTGAFLLAAAGVLDGRPVTTHWEDLEDLRRQFPQVRVVEGLRWVDDGNVVTSAGISAGIDMSLHLVRRLASGPLATATARQMDYDWKDQEDDGATNRQSAVESRF